MPSAATKFAWRPDDALLAVGTEKGQVFVFKTGLSGSSNVAAGASIRKRDPSSPPSS